MASPPSSVAEKGHLRRQRACSLDGETPAAHKPEPTHPDPSLWRGARRKGPWGRRSHQTVATRADRDSVDEILQRQRHEERAEVFVGQNPLLPVVAYRREMAHR